MADDVVFQTTTPTFPPTDLVVSTDKIDGKDFQRMKLVDGTDGATTAAKVSAEGSLQTITPNRTASGTLGALNDTLAISADGANIVVWAFDTSDLSGTIDLEVSTDGTNWVIWYEGGGVSSVTDPVAFTANPLVYQVSVATFAQARLRVSAYTSGSATARGIASAYRDTDTSPLSTYLRGNTGTSIGNNGGTEIQALRVTIANDSTGLLSVDDNGGSLTVDAASLPLPTGAATAALQLPDGHNVTVDNATLAVTASALPLPSGAATAALQTQPGVDIGDVTVNNAAGAAAVNIQDGGNAITVDGTVTANLAAGTNNIGDVDVLTLPQSATATLSNVADTATSTTLLAANAARLGASIWNDSTAVLYVKFGTTASATSATVKMVADSHYEVPFGYTGRIDGIGASDASGSARITEMT